MDGWYALPTTGPLAVLPTKLAHAVGGERKEPHADRLGVDIDLEPAVVGPDVNVGVGMLALDLFEIAVVAPCQFAHRGIVTPMLRR